MNKLKNDIKRLIATGLYLFMIIVIHDCYNLFENLGFRIGILVSLCAMCCTFIISLGMVFGMVVERVLEKN